MQWERARLDAESSDRGLVLALDEIQKIPNWSETVIALAEISAEGELAYALQPALLDDNGNPQLLNGAEARAVIERLDAMSPMADICYGDGFGSLGFS